MPTPTAVSAAAAAAISARDATIPLEWLLSSDLELPLNSTTLLASSGILTAVELEIVSWSATALGAAIAARKLTSVHVTTAFCKAASIAQQATNCLVELFVDEALARAAELDAELESKGPRSPLHGVPVSLKEHIDLKGHDSPSGFLALVGKMVASEDAVLVHVLRNAGAVFFAKTTNPQSIMHIETESYLGTTVSPFNRRLTSGGSTGGEGALLGMRGSPLGVGTDIGGSLRCPAASGGVYGFKPTCGRSSFLGCQAPHFMAGYEGIFGTTGPMARSIDDLELYMKLQADSDAFRTDVTGVPWTTPAARRRPRRIGVMADDGLVRPVTPIRKALHAAATKLRADPRFEVVEHALWAGAADDAWKTIAKLYWAHDAGAGTYEHIALGGEEVHPLTQWVIDEAGLTAPLSASELYALQAHRNAFRARMAAHWNAAGIDVLLSPAGPTPSPPHRTAKYWNYTAIWNLVDYPAGVFPTGRHAVPEDVEDYVPRNAQEQHVRQHYDPQYSVGAPIALQVVGFHGCDEETLAALREIVAAAGN